MTGHLCPSFAAVPGALLLGRLADDGTMGLLRTPIPVSSEFLDRIDYSCADTDTGWRFAGPCLQGACSRWSSGQCQVVKQAVELPLPLSAAQTLPECGIRDACRWHSQQGPAACAACIFIVRHPAAASS